eukprot:Clim_evm27s150 gene=Clim_evmTU27s150
MATKQDANPIHPNSEYRGPKLATLCDVVSTTWTANPESDLALVRAAVSKDSPIDHSKDVKITFSQLKAQIEAVKSELHRGGLRKGDCANIVIPNSPEFIVVFLAVTSMGAIAGPLNPAYKDSEHKFYMEDEQSKVLICLDANKADAEEVKAARGLNMKVWGIKLNEESNNFEMDIRTNEVIEGASSDTLDTQVPEPDTVALILHTSGTTSKPKGVPLTHKNLCTSLHNIATTYELGNEDKCYLVMPLFHVHGLIAATLSTLVSGGTVIIPEGGKFTASNFWDHIVYHKATWYSAVPTIQQTLLIIHDQLSDEAKKNFNKGDLRFIRSCSSSLPAIILERLEAAFGLPVLEAYGMSESCHQMTSNQLPHLGKRKAGTVGVPTNVEVVILPIGGTDFTPLPAGERGEICLRGDNVTPGYINRPEANEEAFAGGWFHTGDEGLIDGDGMIKITGRIKELINRGGEKISPLEIDGVLVKHEGIADAVSFSMPDEKYGEEVACAVILKDGFAGKISEEDVKAFVMDHLATFKTPKKVFIAEDVPRTATGKIQRRIVAAHFLQKN